MRPWVAKGLTSGVISTVAWLAPPPLHLVTMFVPLVSGYIMGAGMAAERQGTAAQVGLVMGSFVAVAGVVIAVGTLLVSGAVLEIAITSGHMMGGALIAAGIGVYTGVVGCLGILWGRRAARRKSAQPKL